MLPKLIALILMLAGAQSLGVPVIETTTSLITDAATWLFDQVIGGIVPW